MIKPHVLIVDDEPDIGDLLKRSLEKMNLQASIATTVEQAQEALNRSIHLCICDLRLPDGDGSELISVATEKDIPIAILTAHGDVQTAVKALKLGAFDFISKPIEEVELKRLVHAALRMPLPVDASAVPLLTGNSECIQALKCLIRKVARSQAPVYIFGPSGAGKENVAQSIHQLSTRAEQPFVPINCGAIPAALIESELFGHVKGSFTGAHSDKTGLFEHAQGGTLFLDEVGDLPLAMQVKLLRAIQEKRIRRVGATSEIPIDVRFLCATAHSLSEMVKKRTFREDLYYRLNVIELRVPPLHERRPDIPELCVQLLENLSEPAQELSKNALAALCDYPFPGNVRELENILERAVALSNQHIIQEEDLQLPKGDELTNSALDVQMQSLEKKTILAALEKTGGNKQQAAEILGIPYRSLRYRISKMDEST